MGKSNQEDPNADVISKKEKPIQVIQPRISNKDRYLPTYLGIYLIGGHS